MTMFNLLKKKYKSLDQYPDTWNVRETTLDGDKFIVRVCVGLLEAIGHPDYPYQIGIAIPLNWKTESGIVSSLESSPINEIELKLEKELVSKNTGLAAVLTGRNMKEFIFYTSEPKVIEDKIKKIKSEIRSHELQYIIQHDPKWNTYKFMIEGQNDK